VPFLPVSPDDLESVAVSDDIINAARVVDDPSTLPAIAELTAGWLRYGWDLEPDQRYLYLPEGSDTAVGVLDVGAPLRDNLHLVWAEIVIHPDHRRQGHGSVVMAEVLRQARELGRNTVWVGGAADDLGARAFAEHFGFVYASHDARRRQQLAEVDHQAVERLYEQALTAAADYRLERMTAPIADDVLEELVEVTSAINDAPMGDLTFEDEKFDLARMQDIEAARLGRNDKLYRVAARHRETGEVGGHTVMVVNPLRPTFGGQGDTAVSRQHRGHRLGLLLKIDMMHWLADAEPQLEVIETWNNADNIFMISVNESIGYRLSRVFNMYELKLG